MLIIRSWIVRLTPIPCSLFHFRPNLARLPLYVYLVGFSLPALHLSHRFLSTLVSVYYGYKIYLGWYNLPVYKFISFLHLHKSCAVPIFPFTSLVAFLLLIKNCLIGMWFVYIMSPGARQPKECICVCMWMMTLHTECHCEVFSCSLPVIP